MRKPVFPGIILLLVSALFSCKEIAKTQKPVTAVSAIPHLTVLGDTGTSSLKISSLSIDIAITGNVANTVFDITFSNPYDRVLEGEFEFPLADGQSISRYALEIDNKLREGVVVEKEQARVAYENTVRQNIDPGLVEKTKGNNFRTRIYPIPARGRKRVVIGIEQKLSFDGRKLLYQLPIQSGDVMNYFSVNAVVNGVHLHPSLIDNLLEGFSFKQNKDHWLASFEAKSFSPNHNIAITLPFEDEEGLVFTGDHADGTSFYIVTPVEAAFREKSKLHTVVLMWDVSASAAKRNINKELELVKKYTDALEDVRITVVPFNVFTQPSFTVDIKNGDAGELIQKLKSYSFDGGTQLGELDLQQYTADEILLFSDGLSTFGKKDMGLSKTPVTVINSSPSADFSYLKYISLQTGGTFIDLTATEIADAAEMMTKRELQFISAAYDPNQVEEVYPAVSSHGGFSIAGRLKVPEAGITLNYGYGNTVTRQQHFNISKQEASYPEVNRVWANMKIDQLALQYQKNKEAITVLGKEFSIVTQNTSLLVLDRVEDYVRYRIIPPAELQKEYYSMLKQQINAEKQEKELAFKDAVSALEEMKDWWQRSFSVEPPRKVAASGLTVNPGLAAPSPTIRYAYNGNANFAAVDSVAVGSYSNSYSVSTFKGAENEKLEEKTATAVQYHQLNEPPAPADETDKSKQNISSGSIQLNEWQAETPYLKTLNKTNSSHYFDTYLTLKKDYLQQPSFFIDVARFFFEKHEQKMGIQVLSNIAEMKLEDAELMRMVANELAEIGEKQLALESFKDIMEMRGEEPQSYRDLALAYNETGNYNEAVQLLYKVATNSWDSRFGDVKAIALNEMNAIISAHPGMNTSGISKKLVAVMPVDVRIVISWSADNTDIDLWVTDPQQEKCYYGYNETQTGGRISNDVIQGYGPEEYCIKKATNGNYEVEINLFGDRRQTLGGPITVKAELFTNYGRANQQRKLINCRLTSTEEVIKIGSLHFKNKS